MAHTSTRIAAAATLTAGALAISLAATQPAGAQVNPGYQNAPRWAVTQDANWETMSNLTMRSVYRMDPYGYRAGFCLAAGNRWDSGTFYGSPWGNLEARAHIVADGPAGPCTVPVNAAALLIDTNPLYVAPGGRLDWYPWCRPRAFNWNTYETLAEARSWACAAPTDAGPGSNYRVGGYSQTVVITGQAFPDQPSSAFTVQWNTWPAFRR